MSDPVVLLSTGDVVGPAGGVTDNSMVLFSGTSGKLIKGNNAVVTAAGLALLDDVNAAAQRTTLGLKTGAVTDKTTSATDPTVGSLTKVGDFGVGGMLDLRSTIFVTGKPQDLYSKGFVKGFADGGPAGLAIPGIVGINYGALELNAHWYEPSGAGGIMRSFTKGGSGVVYTQTMLNATTWGDWQEIALINSPAFTGTPTAPTPSIGTRSTAIATMQNFANEFGASITSNGYQKLPSGLIVQWVRATASTPGSSNVFPIAFPNNLLMLVSGAFASSGGVILNFFNATTSGFTLVKNTGVPDEHYVIAIGH